MNRNRPLDAILLLSLAALSLSFAACGGIDPRATDPAFAKSLKEAEKKAAEDAARAAAAEAAKPHPDRENYHKVRDGMTVAQVEAILGPGKENASGSGVLIMTWEFNQPLTNVISVTFQRDKVVSKAIAP